MTKVQTENTSNLSNAWTRAYTAILTATTHMTPGSHTFQYVVNKKMASEEKSKCLFQTIFHAQSEIV